MTLKVPLTGTNVVPEGDSPAANGGAGIPGQTQPPAAPQPKPARPSLHQLRMNAPQPQVEVRGEFDDKGRVKWVPVEQAQEQGQPDDAAGVEDSIVDARGDVQQGVPDVPPLTGSESQPSNDIGGLQRQIQDLTQTVGLLAQMQMRGAQPEPAKPQAPTPPDPAQFDFYDAQSVAEYNRLNQAYMDAAIQYRVNAALEPHGSALQDAQLNAQYNGVYAQFGQDPNFKATMQSALQLVARFPSISIPEAYKHMASTQLPSPHQSAAPSQSAKPASRTITAQEAAQKAEQARKLPASNGVSGTAEPALPANLRNVGALGRIMLHNQQSGRARPIGN